MAIGLAGVQCWPVPVKALKCHDGARLVGRLVRRLSRGMPCSPARRCDPCQTCLLPPAGGDVVNVLFAALLGGFALGQAAPNMQYFMQASARLLLGSHVPVP